MSKKVKIEQRSGALLLSYRWLNPAVYFLTFFALIWNTAILFFLIAGAGWFIIIHLAVGVFIGWWVLAMWFNRTKIEVNRQRLSITHGPVPWLNSKDHEIPAGNIQQLAVKRTGVKVNEQATFNLVAIMNDGSETKLLKTQQDLNLVQNLEQTIENFLGITDDPAINQIGPNRQLDLAHMAEHLEKLESVKKWMPRSMREGLEQSIKHAYAQQEAAASTDTTPSTTALPSEHSTRAPSPPSAPEPILDESISSDDSPDYVPPQERENGHTIQLRGLNYVVANRAEITYDDPHHAGAAQLELRGRDTTYLYADLDGNHWRFFEERRLDDSELSALGFTYAGTNPHRMENGDDRYYPSDKLTGKRQHPGGFEQNIEMWTYISTTDSHLFRAMRVEGEHWEVYVMELVPEDLVQ